MLFERYIGIDYSGARLPLSSLKGLRAYLAAPGAAPKEVHPPASARKYWTRRGLAEWLVEVLRGGPPTLIGIDHGFSFPLQYFERHRLPLDWPNFLADFQRHWPTDLNIYVDRVRDGLSGNGAARTGDTRWRRLAERRARAAKSVFLFDVNGSVAKSTHAGLPWLRYIRNALAPRVHFWPFDGWDVPAGESAITEVYPALWSGLYARGERTQDQHDAFSVAAWLSQSDTDGTLAGFLKPELSLQESRVAQIEGWILGVPGAGIAPRVRKARRYAPT